MNNPVPSGEIIDIIEDSSSRLGIRLRAGSTRPLATLAPELRVADATSAYLVDGRTKHDDCVLIVSPKDFPDAVDQNSAGATKARTFLGEDLGGRVCVPLLTNRWQGRSYAVYPRLSGFSENRLVSRAQKIWVAPAIMRWLEATFARSVVACTASADLETRFVGPLMTLNRDNMIPAEIRATARAAERALADGRVRTVTCLEHCDFWTGNILFERSAVHDLAPFTRRFRVIDWGGCRLDGYPGIDAVRLLLSAFGSRSRSRSLINQYCERASLSPTDLSVSCLCALGKIAEDLNHFPKTQFVHLVENVHNFLDRNGLLDDLRGCRDGL